MKKLLGFIFLYYLFFSYANANEKIYLCVGESGVSYMTAIKQNKMSIWYGTKNEKEAEIKETDDRFVADFDDRSIIFFKRTNLIAETWKDNGNQSFDACKQIN